MVCIGSYYTWTKHCMQKLQILRGSSRQVCEHHPSDGHLPHHHDLRVRDTCIASEIIAEGAAHGVLEERNVQTGSESS